MSQRSKKSAKDLDALGKFIAEGAAVMAGQGVEDEPADPDTGMSPGVKHRRKPRAAKPSRAARATARGTTAVPAERKP